MRAARTTEPASDARPGPWSKPEEPRARLATRADAAAPSPVHALQGRISREFDGAAQRKFNPAEVAIRLMILLYVAGFWWGLAALTTTWVRHVVQ